MNEDMRFTNLEMKIQCDPDKYVVSADLSKWLEIPTPAVAQLEKPIVTGDLILRTEPKKSCEAVNYKVYGDTVVVLFADGTKTACTCADSDKFDLEEGIFLCIVKKLHGNTLRNDARALVKKVRKAEEKRVHAEEECKAAKQRAEMRKCKKIEQNLRRKAKREALYQEMLKEEITKLSEDANAQ